MKIFVRTLIILAAALLVVGATWALGNSSVMGQLNLGPRGREGFELRERGFVPPNTNESSAATGDVSSLPRVRPDFGREGFEGRGRGEGFEGRGGAFNTRALASFGQTLIPITLTILLVTFVLGFFDRMRRRNRKATPPATLTPTEETNL